VNAIAVSGADFLREHLRARLTLVLLVAIPALFGYNYLASRIKNISSDMHVFVDEFVSKAEEQYGE